MIDPPPSTMTAGQALLNALVDEGVDVAFGYPGGAIMPLYDAFFSERRITHVLVRHEQAAAFAASAYARTTGKVGVAIATSGPGATNLITGILDAQMDSVPFVAITGQVRSDLIGTDAFQEADVTSLAQPITKRAILVRRVEDVVPSIHEAFRLARTGRPGPVLVDVPSDILKTHLPIPTEPREPVRAAAAARRPDARAIAQAIEILTNAKAPLVIAGGGVRLAGAVDEFRRVVALLGAPHAATINALGCAATNDPSFLGMLGMHGWKRANKAVNEADVILALGMRFDDRVTGRVDRFAADAKIIHVDVDIAEIGKIIPVTLGIHADVRETLLALEAELLRLGRRDHGAWCARVESFSSPLPTDRSIGNLGATEVIEAFMRRIPANTVVATDVGQHQMWTAQRVRPTDPHSFLTSAGLGAMGFGLPAAIGAKFGHPDRPVVVVVGDGGFQMTQSELATIGRYNLDIKILLVDNRRLGMVRQWQELFYERRYAATDLYDNPDFTMLARAYRIGASRVDRREALDAAIEGLLATPGPALLHCECFPSENVWPMIPAGAAIDEAIEGIEGIPA